MDQAWSRHLNAPASQSGFDLSTVQHTMTFGEEYEDYGEYADVGNGNVSGSGALETREKQIKRRSSKACDQCRKSKCKCERSAPGEACRNCVMLGSPCTFLGPSRKRGPPKGYIDALEARLHQTEALIGILLSCSDSGDEHSKAFLEIVKQDALAKQIIARIDNSPYGPSGRRVRGGDAESLPGKHHHTNDDIADFQLTHPSNGWQDKVTALVTGGGPRTGVSNNRSVRLAPPPGQPQAGDDYRRQRRRVESLPSGAASSPPHIESSSSYATASSDDEPDEDLADAVGQLSLNEDAQVRYHGKASGLHLLGIGERVDHRNEGGIWRFPKARVWPPLPSDVKRSAAPEEEDTSSLPSQVIQEHLLELYFTYVHPALPVVHKRAFFEAFRSESQGDTPSPDSKSDKSSSPFNRKRRQVPTLLLLTMYALAARYSSEYTPPVPADGRAMWAAGDEYLDSAKVLLDRAYAGSCPQTCQALLLLGYREIGIGAMAQAWTYIGMAVRMAQDLGLHRSADGWARAELGGQLFGEWELHERKRIWYACVIMDKYVSTYIGRPLCIFERDFDTPKPDENDPEEYEDWEPHPSPPIEEDQWQWVKKRFCTTVPAPGRVISCFNASASLSGLLGSIVEAIYAVRPAASRHSEAARLEGLLDKWYIDLPEHLRHEPGSNKAPAPPPHILTLHMQYWCAVLLLHRPFIRHHLDAKNKTGGSDKSDDGEVRAMAEKSYELCAAAANHITSIVGVYVDNYCLKRSAVFLCYYIFTASIMHVTTLMSHPVDPQARMGLKQCKEALRNMDVVWPSAGRALELLLGSKVNLEEEELEKLAHHPLRQKRPADFALDDGAYSDASLPAQYFSQDLTTPRNFGLSQAMYALPDGPDVPEVGNEETASYFASLGRWPAEADQLLPPLQGTLSTSVLPQLYSTGLVGGRGRAQSNSRSESNFTSGQNQGQRYPQYWNDFSAYSQLGNAYGNVPRHLPASSQPDLPYQMHYNLYNNPAQSTS